MKPAPSSTWILVCDAGHARIFAVTDKEKPWTQVQAIENPRGRLKTQDLVTDRPGRVQESAALGRRSAMEPDTNPREVEAQRFARELADLLDQHIGEHLNGRLLITAPPHFLGLLRGCLSDRVQKRLTASVDHDYTWVAASELPERLAAYL